MKLFKFTEENFKTLLSTIFMQFIILFFNFTFIRFFVLPDLGFNLVKNTSDKLISAYIMFCYDFLIALLLALIFSPFLYFITKSKKTPLLFFIFNITITSFFSLFILYANFFKSNISLLHLTFLFDFDFVKSSYSSIFNKNYLYLITLNLGAILLVINFRTKSLLELTRTKIIIIIFLCIICNGLKSIITESHTFKNLTDNIADKNITRNFIYSLFKDFKAGSFKNEDFKNFDPKNDYEVLYKWKYKKNNDKKIITENDLLDIIQSNPIMEQNEINNELKNQIQKKLQDKDPLYVWVILLESFKPQNGKWLYPNHKYSFMPFYDKLSESGLSFSNAWTVAGVTRAGQQGTLCGTWTGDASEALRSNYIYYPQCITDILKTKYPDSKNYFWYGGDLNFDNTKAFWIRHGVDFISGENDFDSTVARTSWGASDKSLFDKVQQNLLKSKENPKLQFHIIMTLTNHSEFKAPSDIKFPNNNLAELAENEMQKTTYYSDLSLERFIHFIKNEKMNPNSNTTIWDQSLIVLVNDHGNLVPDIEYPSSDSSSSVDKISDMSFRANLIFQGGLVQNSLKKFNLTKLNSERSSSQADIYPTILSLLNFKNIETISDPLFTDKRRWPVYSETNGQVYVHPFTPKSTPTIAWSRKDLLHNKNVNIPEKNSDYYLTAKYLFKINEYLKYRGLLGKSTSSSIPENSISNKLTYN